MALRLLDHTNWWLFQIQASGFPRELCGPECEAHREAGSEAMEDCPCLTCHSSYSATRDKDRLREMWDRHPHGLLALRTGAKSNVVVLDFDLHYGGGNGAESLKLLIDRGLLRGAIRSFTGGSGAHVFFSHPGPEFRVSSSQSKIAPGVDVKGENSFVVLPPSQKVGKEPYVWYDGQAPYDRDVTPLPGGLRYGMVTKAQAERSIDIMAVDFTAVATSELEYACNKLVTSMPGERNHRLFQAACRAGEAIAGGAMTKAEAEGILAVAVGKVFSKPDNNDRKTIRSGIRTGMADALRGHTRDVR